MQAGEFWATIIERNVIPIIISIAQCCIFLWQASSSIAYSAYSLFMSTHSLCANNANVIQAMRCLAAMCLKAWVFVGQMDAAPGLPSPLTPHRCPILAQSSVTKRWKISNAPEPTCQYAGTIRRVGAAQNTRWLQPQMKEGKEPCGASLRWPVWPKPPAWIELRRSCIN